MRHPLQPIFQSIIMACCASILTASAMAETPWETAAVQGITAMNKGDGKAFVAVAHTGFKKVIRDDFLKAVDVAPTSADVLRMLQAFGVSSRTELLKMPLDDFVASAVVQMNQAIPVEKRDAMHQAKVKLVDSQTEGDVSLVTVDQTIPAEGTFVSARVVLVVAREGEAWKYGGHASKKRAPESEE